MEDLPERGSAAVLSKITRLYKILDIDSAEKALNMLDIVETGHWCVLGRSPACQLASNSVKVLGHRARPGGWVWGALDSDVDVGVYGGANGGELVMVGKLLDWIGLAFLDKKNTIISIIFFIQNILLKKMNMY